MVAKIVGINPSSDLPARAVARIQALINTALSGHTQAPDAHGDRAYTDQQLSSYAGTNTQALATKAPLDSPNFTGTPKVNGEPLLATAVAVNTQTGTTYTLAATDAGKVVERSNAAANTVTIPPNSVVPVPVGAILEVFQAGLGQTTIVPGTGVTLRAPDGAKIAKQYGSVSLRKRGTDEWVIAGNTTP